MAVDIIARAMAAQAGGGSGGEPAEYLKTASVANNVLTLVHKDGSTTVFNPDGADLNIKNGTGTKSLVQKESETFTLHEVTYDVDATGKAATVLGGKAAATGSRSFASGSSTVASGDYAHSEGVNTLASGNQAHAEGSGTTASESAAHAEGSTTTASNIAAHAEGFNTKATARYAHAEGNNTEASGECAHAQGHSAGAYAENSFSSGESTKAYQKNQTVVGQFNDNTKSEHILFEVGNGESASTKSNAFEVYKDGHAEVKQVGLAENSVVTKIYVDAADSTLDNKIDEKVAELNSTISEKTTTPIISITGAQLVDAGQKHGATYITLSTTTEQQTILSTKENIILDFSAIQTLLSLPVSSINIRKNTVNVLQGLSVIQFCFDNAGFEYEEYPDRVSLKELGNGGALYESTSSKRLFITFAGINPTIMWTRIGDCETGITNLEGLLRLKADLVNGKVPAAQLPSYVDDVIEGYFYGGQFYEDESHTTLITPEVGKVYVNRITNFTYRWSGSQYIRLNDIDLTQYATKTYVDDGLTTKQNAFDLDASDDYGGLIFVDGKLGRDPEVIPTVDYVDASVGDTMSYVMQEDDKICANFTSKYDSSKTYNTGDYVINSHILWKAKEDGITGTWDITKWESAQICNELEANYITKTSYASTTEAGIIRAGANYGTQVSGQFLQGRTRTYDQYKTDSGTLFVCKGTLENVLVGKNIYSTITLTQAEFDALTEYADDTNYQII